MHLTGLIQDGPAAGATAGVAGGGIPAKGNSRQNYSAAEVEDGGPALASAAGEGEVDKSVMDVGIEGEHPHRTAPPPLMATW